MSERMPKKLIPLPRRTDPTPWLRQALAHRTKDELIDMLVKMAKDDRAVLRELSAHFELQPPLEELLAQTRQAIADATAFDKRDMNRNFSYDDGAYSHGKALFTKRTRGQEETPLEPLVLVVRF